MRKIDKIIIHCSATPPTLNIGAAEIRLWHIERGWKDIGYHYVIRRDGTIEPGRPIEKIGAHCKGKNKNSIGLCLIGGVDKNNTPKENFTPEQWETLAATTRILRGQFKGVTVHGHNEFSSKACPSFDVQKWVI